MSGIRIVRGIADLSKRIGTINLAGTNSTKLVIKENHENPSSIRSPVLASFNLAKNRDLQLTAAYWSQQIKPKIEIVDPLNKAPIGRKIESEPELPVTQKPTLEDPNADQIIEKKAHRMLRIKKKKMKMHRRKKRWKKNWVSWRKWFAAKVKKSEVEFRQQMIAKVNEANKFDPNKYVDDYLEDMKYELIPKTYKGRRLPQWLIKEILEEDEKKAERIRLNQTNLLTGEPLIHPNESVQSFIQRTNKK